VGDVPICCVMVFGELGLIVFRLRRCELVNKYVVLEWKLVDKKGLNLNLIGIGTSLWLSV